MKDTEQMTDTEKFVDATLNSDPTKAKKCLEAILRKKCADKIRKTLSEEQ